MEEIKSIAYYIAFATRRAATPTTFDILRNAENFIATLLPYEAGAKDCFADTVDLVDLINIHITQDQFLDVLSQIERGVRPGNISIPVAGQPFNPEQPQSYFQNYINRIQDPKTEESVEKTLKRLNEVMQGISYNGYDENGDPVVELHNPKLRANGLVVGRVQSGKTRNYIGLMLKAFEEGWNAIFVLTSNSTELRSQTAGRIAKDLARAGITDRCARQIDVSNRNSDLRPANETRGYLYWGVIIKEVNNIGNFKSWLDQSRAVHNNLRVMIIDDEADNASPNSNSNPDLLEESDIDLELEKILDLVGENEEYENLGAVYDWFQNLRTFDAEHNAITMTRDILASGSKSAKAQRDALLNDALWRSLTGATTEVVEGIYSYYQTGRRSPNVSDFILLVKSIADIANYRSQINGGIIQIVDKGQGQTEYTYGFKHVAYIAYTATPYACILNENPNATSIYPDFIQSLDKSKKYFGLAEIFGQYDPDNRSSRMPILQTFDDKETEIVEKVKDGAYVDGELCVDGDEWVGLKNAIAYFICTAAARRVRRLRVCPDIVNDGRDDFYLSIRDDLWTSMLVNIHHTIGVMSVVKGAIKSYLRNFLQSENFLEDCHAMWVQMTSEFTEGKFQQLFPEYGAFEYYPTWERLLPHLEYFRDLDKIQVVVLNTGSEGREDSHRYSNEGDGVPQYTDDHAWIVCGGNKISRGLTLPGLTVSYFDRLNKTIPVDTMTQMGRWFGYRHGYEMLPRIWMRPANLEELKKIAQIEEILHPSIRENFDNHYSPADPNHFQTVYSYGRKLSGRARSRRQTEAPMGAMIHSKMLPIERDDVISAYGVIRSFAEDHPAKIRSEHEYQYSKIPLWENVSSTDIQNLLLELKPYYPEKTQKVLNALISDMNSSEETDWDVVLGTPERGVRATPSATGPNYRFGNFILAGAHPQIFHKDQVLESESRLHISFYANFPTTVLAQTTEDFKRDYRENHPEDLPEGKDLPEGVRNRSDSRYMATVFKNLGGNAAKKPVLQFYVIDPQGNVEGLRADVPLIAISVYWPDHSPDYFVANEVGYEPPPRTIEKAHVFTKVAKILREANFPMKTSVLRAKFLEYYPLSKFPNAEIIYNANVRKGCEKGYRYYPYPGKDAYASESWTTAEHAEEKLEKMFMETVASILRNTTNRKTLDEIKSAVIASDSCWWENIIPAVTPSNFMDLIQKYPMYNLCGEQGRPFTFWFNRGL